jgi:mRNA interferase RelE/StbE
MYEIIFSEKFENQLKKFDKNLQKRILLALERVRIKPENYFKRLVGEKVYSLRVGNYRILADIDKDKLIILLLKAGHRKNIYKK